MFIFISGSSGSGKSLYAEEKLIALSGDINSERIYLATSRIYDSEMKSRVARHRLMRSGKNFITIEKACSLCEIAISHNACVLLEDLATWTANEMFDNNSDGGKIFNDITNIIARCKHLVLVSCEIFSDGIKYDALTENYVKTLAGLHVKLAAVADEIIEVNAGLIIRYK